MTARAIGQASATRSYLEKLKQDDNNLPDGPVVMSPDGLIKSLSREVKRKPHEFKISCLNKIRRLFPSNARPFYCGFGNRETDTLSYREVGVPDEQIFIINKQGDLSQNHLAETLPDGAENPYAFTQTYKILAYKCDEIFPSVIN